MKWLLLICFCFLGCGEGDFTANQGSQDYRVELYSDGELVREWVSVGSVGRTRGVYNFVDQETGSKVWISSDQGNLVITQIEE